MVRLRNRRNTSEASTSSRPTISTLRLPGRKRSARRSRGRSKYGRLWMFGADGPPNGSAAFPVGDTVVSRIFREEHGRPVASLIRAFGDIDAAEDAVQEAFAVALRRRPGDGLPPNPGGWIPTTARNLAIDRQRREARGRELLRELAVLLPEKDVPNWATAAGTLEGAPLRPLFSRRTPFISPGVRLQPPLRP